MGVLIISGFSNGGVSCTESNTGFEEDQTAIDKAQKSQTLSKLLQPRRHHGQIKQLPVSGFIQGGVRDPNSKRGNCAPSCGNQDTCAGGAPLLDMSVREQERRSRIITSVDKFWNRASHQMEYILCFLRHAYKVNIAMS